jgi:hypothetical protein
MSPFSSRLTMHCKHFDENLVNLFAIGPSRRQNNHRLRNPLYAVRVYEETMKQ